MYLAPLWIGVGADIPERTARIEIVRPLMRQGLGRRVCAEADHIPFIARPKDRQHQVTSRLPAPPAERLAKIRVRLRELRLARDVDEPTEPSDRVKEEALRFIPRAAPLSL